MEIIQRGGVTNLVDLVDGTIDEVLQEQGLSLLVKLSQASSRKYHVIGLTQLAFRSYFFASLRRRSSFHWCPTYFFEHRNPKLRTGAVVFFIERSYVII